MRDEMHAIVRQLLQAAAQMQAEGVLDDPSEPLPAGEAPSAPPAPAPTSSPAAAAPARTSDARWSRIAAQARDTPPRGDGAMRAVRQRLGECTRCPLARGRHHIVFGVGDPSADLVVIGEGPGEQEDLQGEPFVGPAGQMLDRMLANVLGLERSDVYIANIVKCRPPGNRNPKPDEIDACLPVLHDQLRALQPKVGLVLGSVAFKALFGTSQGITRARGRWTTWHDPVGQLSFPVMPTFHPAYLLRVPEQKRATFEDLKQVRQRYDEVGGRRSG